MVLRFEMTSDAYQESKNGYAEQNHPDRALVIVRNFHCSGNQISPEEQNQVRILSLSCRTRSRHPVAKRLPPFLGFPDVAPGDVNSKPTMVSSEFVDPE
jgi:hypothetical protein